MNLGSTPTPPDPEGLDPLLAALRQRLGDYGEAPPPTAWAAIRRQVAPPRPWWRRQQRLLPLLALLAGLQLVSITTERNGHSMPGAGASLPKFAAQKTNSHPTSDAPAHDYATAGTSHVPAVLPATAGVKGQQANTSQPLNKAIALAHRRTIKQHNLASEAGQPLAQERRSHKATAARALAPRPATTLLSRSGKEKPAGRTRTTPAQQLAAVAARPKTIGPTHYTHYANRHRHASAYLPTASATNGLLSAEQLVAGSKKRGLLMSPQRPRLSQTKHYLPSLVASRVVGPTQASNSLLPATQSVLFALPPSTARRGSALDLLALKQPSLLLPELEVAPPLIPAAHPDSIFPAPAPVRRWALLVLAGPTLSYRTLGPAPALAVGHPDFARLERPALGLGAQMQVRRVLSGRWALAVGAGYQEYATRLALSVKDSTTYRAVRQRDTYRLLTVPVQFTYALGAPRRKLLAGLLLGAEPGWYVGGRSTEGSNCGCGQQPYTSAASSPYRSLTLAFSLGFDLRYRLGGPQSRWQWLVQPTGRYVATPFVRNEVVGFTRRQPFSLGLLTGFSWDIH